MQVVLRGILVAAISCSGCGRHDSEPSSVAARLGEIGVVASPTLDQEFPDKLHASQVARVSVVEVRIVPFEEEGGEYLVFATIAARQRLELAEFAARHDGQQFCFLINGRRLGSAIHLSVEPDALVIGTIGPGDDSVLTELLEGFRSQR